MVHLLFEVRLGRQSFGYCVMLEERHALSAVGSPWLSGIWRIGTTSVLVLLSLCLCQEALQATSLTAEAVSLSHTHEQQLHDRWCTR